MNCMKLTIFYTNFYQSISRRSNSASNLTNLCDPIKNKKGKKNAEPLHKMIVIWLEK